MRGNRPPAKNGDEQDAFAPYHTELIWRAGQRRRIRARANRRERHTVRIAIRAGLEV